MKDTERVEFRPATPDDESFLGEMLVASIYWDPEKGTPPDFPTYCDESPLTAKNYVLRFGDRPGDMGVIAESGGARVGAAWSRYSYIPLDLPEVRELTPGYSYEVAIAVRPEVRRRGIGKLLLQQLSLMALKNDQEYLMLGVDEDNVAAKELYAKSGFLPHADYDKDETGYMIMLKQLASK